MEVHSVWKHFLDVADFDWHIRAQKRAVDIDATRVNVIEAPNPEVLNVIVEVATRLKVDRLVFLDRHHRHPQQVGPTDDVPLELYEIWPLGFQLVLHIRAIDADFFFSFRIDHVPWAHESVILSLDPVGRVPWPDEVDVTEFVTALNNSGDGLLLHAEFDRVGGLADP